MAKLQLKRRASRAISVGKERSLFTRNSVQDLSAYFKKFYGMKNAHGCSAPFCPQHSEEQLFLLQNLH